MKNIEQYDILTLEDDKDYSVIDIVNKNDSVYYLMAEIDKDENPIFDSLRILEDNKDGTLSEVLDNNILEELRDSFINNLNIPE